MGASECIVQRWPSILPHLTRCSRTHAHLPSSGVAPPIHPSCVSTLTRVVCHYSCLVLCSCGCRCPWHCVALALALSLCPPPPVSTTHTRGCFDSPCVYDHLASPRHRGCVAMNTMRVGYNSNRWPPFSFGSAESTSSFHR